MEGYINYIIPVQYQPVLGNYITTTGPLKNHTKCLYIVTLLTFLEKYTLKSDSMDIEYCFFYFNKVNHTRTDNLLLFSRQNHDDEISHNILCNTKSNVNIPIFIYVTSVEKSSGMGKIAFISTYRTSLYLCKPMPKKDIQYSVYMHIHGF